MADEERKPWDQLVDEGEDDYWFKMFLAYKLQDPRRRSLITIENEQRELRGEAKSSAISRSWRLKFRDFRWKERAAAWDREATTTIESETEKYWAEKIMKANETLGRLSEVGRANINDFVQIEDGKLVGFNEDALRERGYLVKKLTTTTGRSESIGIELYDAQSALGTIGKHYGLFLERPELEGNGKSNLVLPADSISPNFLAAYRDIKNRQHTEYLFYGGRGSTKSSFVSLMMIWLLVNNPTVHGVVVRQVANTLRDSAYSQIVWAIAELGQEASFKCNTSPLEITYLPTGQKIYFRGADDPGKIKSIRPPFGYTALLWFEELDQLKGDESIRKIEQSVIRGGDLAWIFKTFNPPKTSANWANLYCKIPKSNQFQHKSTYLDVPVEWLGKNFLEEAEHLKSVNPKAYQHEYLGDPTGMGGLVFENVEIRDITDEEIAQFDQVRHGLDFGWYPDPLHWSKVHYDAGRMILYIYDEFRANKMSNRELYEHLIAEKKITPADEFIGDSAEPKSIADLRDYGLTIRPAEKGPESVRYSMKWLQSLNAIVIDPARAPQSMREFLNYEYETDKDGNFISSFPDENNHAIDSVRYAMNQVWRRRGK